MSIGMALRPRGATAEVLLTRLVQPLLLIWGEADRLVPIEVGELLARLNPDLRLERLEGVGHCPHDEAPEDFEGLLLSWLEGLQAEPQEAGT
jgi:pimeloyl-ACP methyl ester carboxylesterase